LFHWFQSVAPIRVKFLAMMGAQGTAAGLGVAANVANYVGWIPEWAALAATLTGSCLVLAIALVSARLICIPYVETVVRMEALAAGDVDSPVAHTTYRDCVGRMTKAMDVFRQQALEVRRSTIVDDVIGRVGSALQRLARGDLSRPIDDKLPQQYDSRPGLQRRAGSAAQRDGGSE